MVYAAPSDFRQPSLAEYCAQLSLTTAEADDTRLAAAIARMSKRFDDLTNDHYESATLTLTLDGRRGGSRIIDLPKRCTAVTSVNTKDYLGALTLQAATAYRLHTSLNAAGTEWVSPGASDWLEIIPLQYLVLTGSIGYYWPGDPQSIVVAGTFGWTVTPATVKRAVALLVFDQFKPDADVLRRATGWSSATATFSIGPQDEDHPTGIPEVDDIVRSFTYGSYGALVG